MSGLIDTSGKPVFPRDGTPEGRARSQQAKAAPPVADPVTRREYFAAHAPDVPKWYSHTPTAPKPDTLSPERHLQGEDLEQFRQWHEGKVQFEALPQKVHTFMLKAQEMKKIQDAWVVMQQRAKFFAWRWFYADMMIEASNGK